MRISDWSSDVCSSLPVLLGFARRLADRHQHAFGHVLAEPLVVARLAHAGVDLEAVGDAPGAVGEKRRFLVVAGQVDHRQDAEHVVQRCRQRRTVALHQPYALALDRVLVGVEHADQPLEAAAALRADEHTSELQSLMRISYAVFCLKKKKTYVDSTVAHTRRETQSK